MPVHLLGRFRPFERQADHGPRLRGVPQSVERRVEDGPLGGGVVRLTERSPERKLDAGDPRGSGRRGEIGNHRKRDRRDPCRFNPPLCQADGPATDGSDRDEEGDVHPLPAHPLDHCRHGALEELRRIEEIAHEAVVRWGDAPDPPCGSRISQGS